MPEMEVVKYDRDEKGWFVQGNSFGRPTKLTNEFVDKLEQILSIGIRAIIYTDEQMIEAVNEELPEKDRMSITTWKEHKARMLSNDSPLTEIEKRFSAIVKRILREQKEGLFNKLATDDKAWTRWAWIIERKFDEWNIRHKIEADINNDLDRKIDRLSKIIDYVNEEDETNDTELQENEVIQEQKGDTIIPV